MRAVLRIRWALAVFGVLALLLAPVASADDTSNWTPADWSKALSNATMLGYGNQIVVLSLTLNQTINNTTNVTVNNNTTNNNNNTNNNNFNPTLVFSPTNTNNNNVTNAND